MLTKLANEIKANKVSGGRVRITLNVSRDGIIGYRYQHQMLGCIYNFLKASDPDYAAWLHEQGYVLSSSLRAEQSEARQSPASVIAGEAKQSHKTFKLFCLSGIKFLAPIKATKNGFVIARSAAPRQSQEALRFYFEIASPVNQFIQHLIVGLFERENCIYIGSTQAYIETVESLPDIQIECHSREGGNPRKVSPSLRGANKASDVAISELTLKPLESPIFVKKPMPYGKPDKYLFPEDEEFSYYLNKNLKDKWFALFGEPCPHQDLQFNFNIDVIPAPLYVIPAKAGIQSPTEKVVEIPIKNGKPIKIKGTIRPFTVKGHPELIKIGLYCGFGANNSHACGYVEVVDDVNYKG